ncbi:MAG TPA: DUF1848 family protein [Spirochaetota bacterium]|nr:DUF1848 family protein [Spirochaetota bacterium]HPY87473.1 DUF1848 family protein [Spirochaetota bacterium]HQB61157.1 DUF1848 family protein [Spirochaetota bacterium]
MKPKRYIITFSRRTDPAFFMDWFTDKVELGYCYVPNPFNDKPYKVSLNPDDVIALNFWTKNPAKLTPHLDDLINRGFKYQTFFITATNYPGYLESNSPDLVDTSAALDLIVDKFSKYAVWARYDPIIITEKLSIEWHLSNFESLCKIWRDKTERVIVSKCHIDGAYKNIAPKLDKILRENGDKMIAIGYDDFVDLCLKMRDIAKQFGIELSVCCSPGIKERDSALLPQSQCLSMKYLRKVIPDLKEIPISKSQRKGSAVQNYAPCQCVESKDIGGRGTCKNGCIYCYANRDGAFEQNIDPKSLWLSPNELIL